MRSSIPWCPASLSNPYIPHSNPPQSPAFLKASALLALDLPQVCPEHLSDFSSLNSGISSSQVSSLTISDQSPCSVPPLHTGLATAVVQLDAHLSLFLLKDRSWAFCSMSPAPSTTLAPKVSKQYIFMGGKDTGKEEFSRREGDRGRGGNRWEFFIWYLPKIFKVIKQLRSFGL